MEKIWLEQYPAGIPPEVDLDAFASVAEVFERSAEKFADRTAFRNMGASLSYADVDRLSRRFAAYLQKDLGLSKGDRVAIMMPNLLQYPVVLFGTLRAGLTVVNVNPLYTARELKHQLSDSGASVVVLVENFAHVLQEAIEGTEVRQVVTTRLGDMLGFPKSLLVNLVVKYVKGMVPSFSLPGSITLSRALARGASLEMEQPSLGHDDVAFLQYTGGTTGVAKGAVLTHGNMVANMQQALAWLSPHMSERPHVIITALPLYHIFALTANCLTFMSLGGLNHLITNPRDMPGFVRELSRTQFTAITGVNTLFNGLMNTPGFADIDFSPLEMTLGGGMAVQEPVARRWKEITGTTLVEAYGLTETSPAACMNPLDLKEYNGKIGVPVPSTECRVIDDQGNALPPGEPGELCIRGPQVMRGYWNRPEETAKVLDSEGWLRTGDVAVMDEKGFFSIVDRKKDMILVSGFNVYPNEVEEVVAGHPGVEEVGAIGVPDEKSTEAVKVCVVRSDPSLTEEALREYCKQHLAGYKVPRHVEFWDELPKSNVGKILRRELREGRPG